VTRYSDELLALSRAVTATADFTDPVGRFAATSSISEAGIIFFRGPGGADLRFESTDVAASVTPNPLDPPASPPVALARDLDETFAYQITMDRPSDLQLILGEFDGRHPRDFLTVAHYDVTLADYRLPPIDDDLSGGLIAEILGPGHTCRLDVKPRADAQLAYVQGAGTVKGDDATDLVGFDVRDDVPPPVSAAPEPKGWALVVLGLAMLGGLQRAKGRTGPALARGGRRRRQA
jgi:hypothetical protein